MAVVAIVGAELVLWLAARIAPLEAAPSVAAAIAVIGLLALLAAAVRARPSLGETALAVDREGRLGDRVTTALALAVALPGIAAPPDEAETASLTDESGAPDREAEERRFIRRQRRDALTALGLARRDLFRPRLSRRPAAAILVMMLALGPVLFLPNFQNVAIAQNRAVREEANAQAVKLDRLAEDLENKGGKTDDPRTQLAQELRDLAKQLRANPNDLNTNLAKLGAVEAALRNQLNPASEQRAAALATLSRGLSRSATGKQGANPDGKPDEASKNLQDLANSLEELSAAQKQDLARQLSEMQGTASQAGGASAQALRDAAQSLAQGDAQGAKSALDRLAQTLTDTQQSVATNRDLTSAANKLQNARRDLANAGQTGQGSQPGSSGNPGQGGQGGQPGSSGNPGQSGRPGSSGNPGQGGQGGQPGSGGNPGQGGQPGPGGQGGGAIGGGGSNANTLGSGIGGNSTRLVPTNPNRISALGDKLKDVFAPFSRLGKPGDPSYISGSGGSGQTTQGNQQGAGTDPGSYVPYSQVFADFYNYALTSLDRGYVPLSVKDYVRDYFSSLNPTQ